MTGPAWRISPGGTVPVYVVRIDHEGGTARVCSRVAGGWAKQAMQVAAADVFADRSEARAEYRRRKDVAGFAAHERPNLTSTVEPAPFKTCEQCVSPGYCAKFNKCPHHGGR